MPAILSVDTHALFARVAQSAACNRFHTIEQRLCRWLPVSRDRVQTDTKPTLSLRRRSLSGPARGAASASAATGFARAPLAGPEHRD